MSHTFLLEIGLEEMPATVISSAVSDLQNKVKKYFTENNLHFSSIKPFSTPRRLTVLIEGLEEKQPDQTTTVKGPAKRIAVDDEGNWTKAAIGFTKGQKATVEDIVFKEVKGEEYVFVEKHVAGKTAEELIKDLPSVIQSISFPVTMKWGNHSYKFIRPVHWLTVLLDDQVVNTSLFEVEADRYTFGHRFLGEKIELIHATDYEKALKDQFVLVDRDERKKRIMEQITAMCEEYNWQSPLNNTGLLEEVTDLVEYPTAFYGSFNEDFLKVPEEVLETAMADHQRYFPVRQNNEAASFLPYFISVRNGNAEAIDNVRKGNEKVISSRLADAAFFYEEDQKLSIDDFVSKLQAVSFYEKLGSLYDKQLRIERIASILAPYFNASSEQIEAIKRASKISKFDLVTQTVDEFPSLQGEIAGIFARERGETKEVADALSEQYLPTSMDGNLPKTVSGAVLSLADKMDSLLSFFSIDLIPSGSNDPFALRRQAMGIVRIIRQFNVSLPITEWEDKIIEEMASETGLLDVETRALYEQKKEAVREFINGRVNQRFSRTDYDIRSAVLESSEDDINQLIETMKVLEAERQKDTFKPIVESFVRVVNLAEKAEDSYTLEVEQLQSSSEKELYRKLQEVEEKVHQDLDPKTHWDYLVELHPLIDVFFDENMVMSDDSEVKENRLALLKRIDNLFISFAVFNKLVIK